MRPRSKSTRLLRTQEVLYQPVYTIKRDPFDTDGDADPKEQAQEEDENGAWVDIWQFNLVAADDGTTRLVLRSQDAKEGWFWDAFRPVEFIVARGI